MLLLSFVVVVEEKSLSLYVFCKDKKIAEIFRDRTTSGSFVANDSIVQGGCITLPFGGVGHSGTGAYHGRYSFDNLTHSKAVLMKTQGGEAVTAMRYPPVSKKSADRLYYMIMHREGIGKMFAWIKTTAFAAAFIVLVMVVDRTVLASKL